MSDFTSSETSTQQTSLGIRIVFYSIWGLALIIALFYLIGIAVVPALLIPALLQFYWSIHCLKLFSETPCITYKPALYLLIGTSLQGFICYIGITQF